MATEPKTEMFLFRMGATETRMLDELSERSGLSRADVLRQLIRKEHGGTGGAPRVKPKPKRK